MFTKLLGKPTKHEFAQAVIEAAQKAGVSGDISYDRRQFRLVLDGSNHFNLHNVYEEYLTAGPLHRRTLLKRYATLMATSRAESIPSTFREAQPNLLPRIRERSYHGIVQLQLRAEGLEGGPPAYRALADHLAVELVFDLPESMATIDKRTLDEWGVGLELALDVAQQNLAEGSPPRFDSPSPGTYVSAWRDHYDSSRIVLLDLIRELEVKGDPVAMVPNRDLLVVTGSEDVNGLEQMAELAERAMTEPRFMTAIPIRLRWDTWVAFELPEDHSLLARYELLRAQTILRDYDEQKTWLEKIHERSGEDVFVASYSATQSQGTGRVSSYCVWSKDVVTLLPVADTIHFYDGDRPEEESIVASTSWERAREIVGSLLVEQDLCPPRFRVENFPSPEQLERLRRTENSAVS